MEIVKDIKQANCITHSGTMHTDDIFATAFLDMYLGNVKVCRSPIVPDDIDKDKVMVYDIGLGKYDHHQHDAARRENNIPYCAFGLLWRDFGKAYLEMKNIKNVDEVFEMFDKELVEGIDADDNGIFPKIEAEYKVKTISDTFKLFNPGYKSNKDPDQQFIKAATFAKEIIEEEINNVNGKVIAKEKVLEKIKTSKDHKLIFDEYMPYEHVLLSEETKEAKDIYFVVFPSNRGGYIIKTVSKSLEDHNKRMDFPKEWNGLEGKQLQEIANIKGINFCHSTGFLVACDTLNTAQEILDKILKKNK